MTFSEFDAAMHAEIPAGWSHDVLQSNPPLPLFWSARLWHDDGRVIRVQSDIGPHVALALAITNVRLEAAEAALALANKEVERQKALMLEQTKLGTSFFDSYIEEREAKNELRAALALQVQENSELKRTIELFASTEEAKAMLAGFDDLKAGRLSSWTGRCEARTDVFGRCDLSAGHQGPHVNAIGDMWYWPSAAAPVKESGE